MFVSMIVHIDELIEDPTIHTEHCSVCSYISIPRTMSRCTLEHGSCGRTDRVADNDQDKEPTCPSKDIANEYTQIAGKEDEASRAHTNDHGYREYDRKHLYALGRTPNLQKRTLVTSCIPQLNPFTLE
ncbi:conserved hypothetical protein [Histoplasma capsulatum var. duboisii H88]|uniref:Uncharacterized protein n=2 Tax=Ajellomyces capsulatus TaxID=5037 RepID=F0UAU5_AJEC8|nr:conserved hypothetical protein [Histoplasma capsulatum H143]EGC43752.1 conserved hypothetical protein [Histoplasma capsulatum var. duboisii H88]